MLTPAPTAIEPIGDTLPQAGVMATRPATAAVAAPRAVGLPRWIHSIPTQVMSAAEVAVLVFMNASAASGLADSALPELKPNHPTQSRPAPIRHSGRLCGGM